MTIKELLVKLRVQADASALDSVNQKLKTMVNLFKTYVLLKVAGYFYRQAEAFAKTGQHITVLAAAAGLGVEQYQKLAYAAQQNGITHEKFSVGLTRMNHQMERAKNGAVTAIGVFTRAGIKPEEIKSWNSSSDALYALQNAFSRMKGPDVQARKLAVVTELFGRGAHNFLLLMDQGSSATKKLEEDAVRAAAVISAKNVNELNKTKQAWKSFSETIHAQAATIFAAFSPVLRALARKIQESIGGSVGKIDTTAKAWARQFAYSIGYAVGTIARFGRFFADHVQGISTAFFNLINFISASIKALANSPYGKEVSAAFGQMWDAVSGKKFNDEKFQKGFWSALVGIVKVIGLAILQVIQFVAIRLGGVIESVWEQLKESAKKNWPKTYEFIANAVEDLKSLVKTFKETVGDFFAAVKQWIKETYDSAISKYNTVADMLPVLGLKHIAVDGEAKAPTETAGQIAARTAKPEEFVKAQGAGSSWLVDFFRSFSPQKLVDTMQGAQMPVQSPTPGPQSTVMEQTKDGPAKEGSYYNIVVPINIQQPIGTDERKIADLAREAISRFFRDELKDAHRQVAPKAAT